MSQSIWRVSKEEAVGEHGVVVSKHPLASEAGLTVLQRGGNAVDAAVTMAFVLGVVEPMSSGIGGGGLMLYHDSRQGRTLAVDYAMDAPQAAVQGCYELDEGIGASRYGWRKVKNDANVVGYRAVSIPGMVRGLALALERFGTISLADALAPAIRFARDGVDASWLFSLRSAIQLRTLSRFPASAAVFLNDGFPLRPRSGEADGDQLVQTDLARTLELIARDGPSVFYEGEIARAIGEAMHQYDGLLTEAGLAGYQPTVWEDLLAIDYHGCRIEAVPGAAGCITVLQGLAILDGFDLAALSIGSLEHTHLQTEALRRAFADRYRYVADPKQVAVPWQGLLSPNYAAWRRARIGRRAATPAVESGNPWAFEKAVTAGMAAGAPGSSGGDTSTTHLCVIDRDRNIISLNQTLVNSFGSGIVIPGTGILMNNAMSWFDPEPDRPNSMAPGKRGLNNLSPVIVHRNGWPLMAAGSVGGRKIIHAVAQVIMNVVDHGMGIQAAIEAPRIDCSGRSLVIDARFSDDVIAGLGAYGHQVQVEEESFHGGAFSTPVGALIDPVTGRVHGGVDQYRPGTATAY